MEKEKLNFFKRAKYAIFNLEKYSEFAKENVKVAIKYMFTILLISTLIQTVLYIVNANELLNKVTSYVREEIPEYTYEKNNLVADNVKTAYDEEYDFYFALDTENKENLEKYREEMKKHSIGLILLSDETYVYSDGEEYIYTYSQLTEGFRTDLFSTKTKLLESLETQVGIILAYVGCVIFISLYVNFVLVYTMQLLAIALMIYITGKIMGIKLKYNSSFSIAVYSITLSTLLSIIYFFVSAFTSFRIVNFDLMYNIIIYIYGLCAVVMIKLDDVKQKEEIVKEVRKIEEVQEEVHKEIEEAKKQEEKNVVEAVEDNSKEEKESKDENQDEEKNEEDSEEKKKD